MNLFDRLFQHQILRIITNIELEIPKSFLSLVKHNSIKMAYLEKHFIFGIFLQALEKNLTNCRVNAEIVNKLLSVVQLFVTVVYHTFNMPDFYDIDKDLETGNNSLHIQYNESITQLVILSLSSKISELILNLNQMPYLVENDVKYIDMKFIIDLKNKINSKKFSIDKIEIFKDACREEVDDIENTNRLLKLKVTTLFNFMLETYFTIVNDSVYDKPKVDELVECLTTMYLYIYTNNYDDLTTPMDCDKSQEIFKVNKVKAIELFVKLEIFNKDLQSIVLYLETAYLYKIRDTMKTNLNTNSVEII